MLKGQSTRAMRGSVLLLLLFVPPPYDPVWTSQRFDPPLVVDLTAASYRMNPPPLSEVMKGIAYDVSLTRQRLRGTSKVASNASDGCLMVTRILQDVSCLHLAARGADHTLTGQIDLQEIRCSPTEWVQCETS